MIRASLVATSLLAILVAGCADTGGSSPEPPADDSVMSVDDSIMEVLARPCPEAANWPPPQSDADWEALIKASRHWRQPSGLPADTCVITALGLYAAILDAAYPDEAEADRERRFNLMKQRALGGSP